jgi:hypothetical protein
MRNFRFAGHSARMPITIEKPVCRYQSADSASFGWQTELGERVEL